MKKIALGFLFALVLCAGCSSTYDIRLNNGAVITCKGRPKLDTVRNKWVYTDAFGKPAEIPAGRVMEIAPRSMDKDNGQFK